MLKLCALWLTQENVRYPIAHFRHTSHDCNPIAHFSNASPVLPCGQVAAIIRWNHDAHFNFATVNQLAYFSLTINGIVKGKVIG